MSELPLCLPQTTNWEYVCDDVYKESEKFLSQWKEKKLLYIIASKKIPQSEVAKVAWSEKKLTARRRKKVGTFSRFLCLPKCGEFLLCLKTFFWWMIWNVNISPSLSLDFWEGAKLFSLAQRQKRLNRFSFLFRLLFFSQQREGWFAINFKCRRLFILWHVTINNWWVPSKMGRESC